MNRPTKPALHEPATTKMLVRHEEGCALPMDDRLGSCLQPHSLPLPDFPTMNIVLTIDFELKGEYNQSEQVRIHRHSVKRQIDK